MNATHGVILASAGAGKTYRLANRILSLLARGAKPGEIVALTFTRKAAAEFVARVLTTLANAAANEDAAATRAKELGLGAEKSNRAFFQKLLEDTIAESHRLRFGTMDGFFQSLVRTHPFELGLAGGFSLLDPRRAARERRKLLRSLLRSPAATDDAGAFLEAFRLASFGSDSRGAAGLLDRFAGESLELYRESGDAAIWGDDKAVWPQGTPWLPEPDEASRQRDTLALVAALDSFDAGHAVLNKSLRNFAAKAAAHRPGTPISELGDFAAERLLTPAALTAILLGRELSFEYSRKERTLTSSITLALRPVLRGIIGGELRSRLHRTAGSGRLLARYAERYETDVIGAGLLGFADIVHTLAKPEHAAVLEQAAYRLDGAVKHWLFDEFQDTSRRTWGILGACAGETLSAGDGSRSAFFVGDVKQAIYAWNGGDHRLLPELVTKHGLPTKDLAETQRCGPEVVAMVNAVCGGLATAPGIPEVAARDWKKAWHPHTCSTRAAANTGLSRWVVVEKPKRDDEIDPAEARLRVVIERIREGDFLRRGLGVGVLTRTNAEARLAADLLRHADLPCVCETDTAPVRDNPATLTLIAAVRHAAHPGDTLARETVRMSPLGQALDTPLSRNRILSGFQSDGAEATLRSLVTENAGLIPDDPFTTGRILTILGIAREYDATGERDASAFVEFASATLRRDTAAAGRIQVMTVHKSKGLEFDVVFLPFLEGEPIDSVSAGSFEALRDTPASPPRAVLAMPPATLCEADPVLRENLDERRATAAYEQLCALYVALTRAKRELTLISHSPPKGTKENRAPGWTGLLAHAFELGEETPLGEIYAWGEPDWCVGVIAPNEPGDLDNTITAAASYPPRKIPRVITPSGLKDAVLFNTGETAPHSDSAKPAGGGKIFGTEVHRIFEHLDHLREGESETELRARLHATTVSTAPDAVLHAEALDCVLRALRSPEFAEAFHLRAGDRVRTELPFVRQRTPDELISGTFDRVVLHADGSATLYDFKTDACAPEALADRYGEAMRLYREEASTLFGIDEKRIRAVLLHTGTGRARHV